MELFISEPRVLNNGENISYFYSLNGSVCVEHQGTNEYLDPRKYYWKINPLILGNWITTSSYHDIANAEFN